MLTAPTIGGGGFLRRAGAGSATLDAVWMARFGNGLWYRVRRVVPVRNLERLEGLSVAVGLDAPDRDEPAGGPNAPEVGSVALPTSGDTSSM